MYTDDKEIRGNDRAEVANWRDAIPQLFLSFEARLVLPQAGSIRGIFIRVESCGKAGFPPARPRSCICVESQVL